MAYNGWSIKNKNAMARKFNGRRLVYILINIASFALVFLIILASMDYSRIREQRYNSEHQAKSKENPPSVPESKKNEPDNKDSETQEGQTTKISDITKKPGKEESRSVGTFTAADKVNEATESPQPARNPDEANKVTIGNDETEKPQNQEKSDKSAEEIGKGQSSESDYWDLVFPDLNDPNLIRALYEGNQGKIEKIGKYWGFKIPSSVGTVEIQYKGMSVTIPKSEDNIHYIKALFSQ